MADFEVVYGEIEVPNAGRFSMLIIRNEWISVASHLYDSKADLLNDVNDFGLIEYCKEQNGLEDVTPDCEFSFTGIDPDLIQVPPKEEVGCDWCGLPVKVLQGFNGDVLCNKCNEESENV